VIGADVPVRLALCGSHHRALKAHLFPGDGNEAVAFALCGRARRENIELLAVREIVPVAHDACRIRTPHRVAWPGTALEEVLQRAAATNAAVVKFHSHPTGYAWFSETDDIAEAETFPSVFAWLDTDAPMASAIMLPDGKLVGRSVLDTGMGAPLDCIRVADHDFIFWRNDSASCAVPEHARRVAQAFGEQTYRLLRALRIGVVGCSGTGSIVVDQLARNCVGELVLVDPDDVEYKNLNRILNSTAHDAANRINKTAVQRRSVEAMGLGTKVTCYGNDVMNTDVLRALSTCDVLFGCMDSVDGRHVLNKLASAYIIPLIDVGVRLDADGAGGIDSVWAVVNTILPGGSSLLSRRVYSEEDLNAAFLKRTSQAAYEEQRKVGYVKGVRVDQPAVVSVNMDASAAAVNEFLARIHPYRVKENNHFAIRRACLSDPEAGGNEADGPPCPAMQRMVGTGDQDPFLGLVALGQ
jgi:proteasome lid subunit RPN8/RPN11